MITGSLVAIVTPMHEDGRLDTDSFQKTLAKVLSEQRRALVFLNSPCHNPTGYSFDADEWRRVRETVAELSSLGPIALCLDAYRTASHQPHIG